MIISKKRRTYINMEDINKYALRIIKRKSYFIKEFRDKLLLSYDELKTNKLIREFICLDLLNDKELIYLKMNNLINQKLYGKNYIVDYFLNKNISTNLINYTLNLFDDNLFIANKEKITNKLIEKGKTTEYIEKYLSYKGY